MNWMLFWLTAPTAAAALAAILIAWLSYRYGYTCGNSDARAAHSLASLERERANRTLTARFCP